MVLCMSSLISDLKSIICVKVQFTLYRFVVSMECQSSRWPSYIQSHCTGRMHSIAVVSFCTTSCCVGDKWESCCMRRTNTHIYIYIYSYIHIYFCVQTVSAKCIQGHCYLQGGSHCGQSVIMHPLFFIYAWLAGSRVYLGCMIIQSVDEYEPSVL